MTTRQSNYFLEGTNENDKVRLKHGPIFFVGVNNTFEPLCIN